jgi:uncharacterized protein (TIGR02599 family)
MVGWPVLLARPRDPTFREKRAGFTLVEMLVAITVLVVIMGIIFSITSETANLWKNSTGKIEGFRNARAAFEAMTRTIGQATLNTYYDYDASPPTKYVRKSDLHFISGQASKTLLSTLTQISPITHAVFFQAPLGNATTYTGLDEALNACGFYLTYGTDPSMPTFLSTTSAPVSYRYRLVQFLQPSEALSVYDSQTQGTGNWNNWYLKPISWDLTNNKPPVLVSELAENIVALVIWPKLSSSSPAPTNALPTDYTWDTRDSASLSTYNQLPPVVEVTMVAIDEASALKLGNTSMPPMSNLGMGSLFTKSANLQGDLQILEDNLGAVSGNAAGNRIPLHYRVFQSEVPLRGAKWSN